MRQVRVFASFDVNRDADLLRKLLRQSKRADSPFQVVDRSTADGTDLAARMSHVDYVVVLCTDYTHRAANVATEVETAKELGTPYFFFKGRFFQQGSRPSTARIADKVYKWTWGNIRELLVKR